VHFKTYLNCFAFNFLGKEFHLPVIVVKVDLGHKYVTNQEISY
jgi:hypothetical protein